MSASVKSAPAGKSKHQQSIDARLLDLPGGLIPSGESQENHDRTVVEGFNNVHFKCAYVNHAMGCTLNDTNLDIHSQMHMSRWPVRYTVKQSLPRTTRPYIRDVPPSCHVSRVSRLYYVCARHKKCITMTPCIKGLPYCAMNSECVRWASLCNDNTMNRGRT